MPQERHPIIFISDVKENIAYKSPQSGGGGLRLPSRDRAAHGRRILQRLENSWRQFQAMQSGREAVSSPTREGIYLEFRSKAGFDLVTKSLEDIRQGVRLLNIRKVEENGEALTIATVYIPAGKERFFISKLQAYLDQDTAKGNPHNAALVNSIEEVKLAIFESFWQDADGLIPESVPEWCEVWLRTNKDMDAVAAFSEVCQRLGIALQQGAIPFPERAVVLVKADKAQLTELMQASDQIAEYRRARETVQFFVNLSNVEQAEWVRELLARANFDEASSTSVCILDTGVNNGHPLISPVLSDDDLHSYHEAWGPNDHHGHGTRMAGVAVYGNLSEALQSNHGLEIKHIIESGKILPPTGENDPMLYGYITKQVISKAEIQAPARKRIICMAVTAHQYDQGKPSSWSGAIDSLASGAEDDVQRLVILSAGNVTRDWKDYPDVNQISSVHSPSQSWNAISVGAYTELTAISDPNLSGYAPIAPQGGLSPFSTTSLTWEKTKWPIKPEVLFEGGNAAIDGDGFSTECDDLSILTTHHQPSNAQFDSFGMTSAATAKAAWMAAQIQTRYPAAWPETIRGLMIHSADWTQALKDQFFDGASDKAKYQNLIRTCGYGIPNLDKALYCTNNNLVLIAQEYLQPFDRREAGSGYRTKDMHFYELPWPKDVLLALGAIPVKMRVTLSYFIEPGPGEIGWKDKYRYRSHGLKFDVNMASETKDAFVRRVNKEARDEDEQDGFSNDSGRWAIGAQNRHLGSIHSDFIEGTAAEMATCNFIGVFPTIGWWRERSHLGKWNKQTRYSLIVSLETPAVEIDLYTPVAVTLNIPIET